MGGPVFFIQKTKQNKEIKMTSNSKTSNWTVSLRPFIAFAICLGSAFFKTGTRVIVKHLDFVNPILLNCVQYLVLAILSQPIAVCRGKILEPPFQRNQRIMLLLRVLVGVVPNAINFYALQHLPIADVIMISASSPIFTVIYARWFIKEPILKADLLNFVVVFVGIILIVKPPFIFGWTELYTSDPQAKWAILGTILSCIFVQSNVFVVLRQLKGIHWSIPISALGLFGFLLTLPFVLLFGSTCFPENSINRIYMLLTGVTEFVSQAAIVVTAKIENAGTGTLLTIAFDVIITFIGQYLFFKDVPGFYSALGAAFISLAIISSGFSKILNNLDEKHWLRSIYFLEWLYDVKPQMEKQTEEQHK